MQNDDSKKNGDLYVPRKCTATNRVITAKDHASVQINIGHIDENGVYSGEYTTVAFSGFIRKMGEADNSLNRIASKNGLMKDLLSFAPQHRFKGE